MLFTESCPAPLGAGGDRKNRADQNHCRRAGHNLGKIASRRHLVPDATAWEYYFHGREQHWVCRTMQSQQTGFSEWRLLERLQVPHVEVPIKPIGCVIEEIDVDQFTSTI
jgi:hypothetical protein